MQRPDIRRTTLPGGAAAVVLSGDWTLQAIGERFRYLQHEIGLCAQAGQANWDLSAVGKLDSVGAMMLWRAWQGRLPDELEADDEARAAFARIAGARGHLEARRARALPFAWLEQVGRRTVELREHLSDFLALTGQIVLDLAYLARHPREIPWREISANLYKSGARALPVTSLVGFLIGVVLSYLSALQLKTLGADIFIVNILGIGIVRELGPVLVAVLVAGRSGSAMTAQLGVMRVTEEIDALATLGVPRSLRLVLPKVAALSLAMPLIVLWTTAIALLGGMVAANIQLDLSYGFFIEQLPRVVPVSNLWIGLAKGWVFGVLVGLLACHFGLRVMPNTESLSANTTRSVVTAITAVILVDAVFAIATRNIGVGI